MWIHGHSVQVQSPDQLSVERYGFFTRIGKAKKVDTIYWFHFSIPTPVSVGEEPLGIKSATIRFRTSGSSGKTLYMTVRVVAVHVYDGEVCIGKYDNLNLKPDTWKNATMEFTLPKDLSFGLGISVGVNFVGERSVKPIKSGYIDFSSAGACFVDPRLILAKQPHSIFFMAEHPGPFLLVP
jgi:hypothetical protein